ncbi:hypothetical protein [Alteraurantiacibacter aquimixticola]|uniref:Uncharacterized protein n=1 Tax=Alteraurantiacibacter aquimixticola TaxID=2489173 RepID=A0A4T3F371_9SPHN|nr:hypothetical protein [Alteraurantiacibacter aquimixticola]TIX49080.1 hypothetical protein E5222_15245 [Alteraurantiacibacter aquimixticola]
MSKQTQYPRTGFIGAMCVLKWEGMREIDRANEKRVNVLSVFWALSLIGVSAAMAFLDLSRDLGFILPLAPLTLGLLCLRAYLKLLREMDELLRQMQFEAMAVGFGTGLIVGMAILSLPIPAPWPTVVITVSMTLAYCGRIVLGAREMARNARAMEEAGE